MIQIPIFQGKGLVFDRNVVELLHTKHRVVGDLVGTHPHQNSQNRTLTLPAVICEEAVYMLQEKGIVECVRMDRKFVPQNDHDPVVMHPHRQMLTPLQVEPSRYTAKEKLNFEIIDPIRKERYPIFKALWEQGFYINGGLKFGCDFLVYEGDPLVVHAKHMVMCVPYTEFGNAHRISAMVRLATTVHKTILVCALDEMQQLKTVEIGYFSIKQARMAMEEVKSVRAKEDLVRRRSEVVDDREGIHRQQVVNAMNKRRKLTSLCYARKVQTLIENSEVIVEEKNPNENCMKESNYTCVLM